MQASARVCGNASAYFGLSRKVSCPGPAWSRVATSDTIRAAWDSSASCAPQRAASSPRRKGPARSKNRGSAIRSLPRGPGRFHRRQTLIQQLQDLRRDLHVRIQQDRKSVVTGKMVSVRVDLGGRRIIKKKKK